MHRRGAPRRDDEARHQGRPRPTTSSRIPSWRRRCTSSARRARRLFLLTNSPWDYTDAVMSYLLDGRCRPIPPGATTSTSSSCAGAKPAFFTDKNPFLEIDAAGDVKGQHTGALLARPHLPGRQRPRLREAASACGGDHVLYIGDHIYGDMLRAKKSSVWRTAMVLQELEAELDRRRGQQDRLTARRAARAPAACASTRRSRISSCCSSRCRSWPRPAIRRTSRWRARRRRWKRPSTRPSAASTSCAPRSRPPPTRSAQNDLVIDRAFNPYWGAIFREGAENSRFGQQVEDYACVYTTRVSNFLAYSPLRYFRSPRDHMPHELV